MNNKDYYNDFSANTDLQTFLDTEAVQTKRIRHKKHIRYLSFSAIAILATMSFHAFFPHVLNGDAKHVAGEHIANVYHSQSNANHVHHGLTFKHANLSSKGEAAITLDADTGRILYNRSIKHPYHVASLSKLMTMYLVQKKANETHSWNKVVPVPLNIAGMSYNESINNYKLNPHKQYTVKQLYEATGVASSNAAATALGAWVSGGTHRFVRLMNDQAKDWHLNAHFVSASGLSNKQLKPYDLMVTGTYNDSNTISAVDMAKITWHLIKVSPNVDSLLRKPHIDINGQLSSNANNMLRGQKYCIPSHLITGLKAERQGKNRIDYIGLSHSAKTGHKTIVIIMNGSETKSGLTFMKKAVTQYKGMHKYNKYGEHNKSITINQISDGNSSTAMPLQNKGTGTHAHF